MFGRIANFDRFTERARRVLTLAQEEAHFFDHNYIGTEHLLLALVREGDGVAARVLQNLGVQLAQAREAVGYIIGRGDAPAAGPLSLTPRTKRVIELAVEEARRLNHNAIGAEHLLLGLIREGEGVAAGILNSLDVTLDQVREETLRVVDTMERAGLVETVRYKVARVLAGPKRGEASPPKGNVVTCRIDDRDLGALDALVEAGIRTTRSDAAAWLIRAGIEANRPLFEKVDATIAEIRRLRGEAQAIARQLVAEPPASPTEGEDDADAAAAPAG